MELALDAVLVRSSDTNFQFGTLEAVRGPADEQLKSVSASLQQYATLGYQASHFAQAVDICRKMLQPQPPSVPVTQLTEPDSAANKEEDLMSPPLLQPTIFLGATANLFGTGCREAIRFLCAECVPLPDGVLPAAKAEEMSRPRFGNTDGPTALFSARVSKALIHALVVSGGAMEHDIRRACEPYHIATHGGTDAALSQQQQQAPAVAGAVGARFGNINYGGGATGPDSSLFSSVMRRLVSRLIEEQKHCKAASAAKPIPAAYDDVCVWGFGPSIVWYLAGLWLPALFTEALLEKNVGDASEVVAEAERRAESTVLYWAAKNGVPIFSPSFVDGDVMNFVLATEKSTSAVLKLDLVPDIYRLNALAMRSQRSGMIILGGGVVKHHVCNANLMRNGADFTVFINNGQEFDGSDAGARPDEAISWGKIRLDGEYAKVYAEVSLVFPLLVAQAFLPWVRAARGLPQPEQGGEHV
ncbi:putative deoxyhypusine synthase [Trypanosoma conorhini]|uniref:Putative deoxyhypusine synthase n=1 Tax=Trypanosoma conorhini TaxID=83891 RepID=A0A3R7L3L3_9TRYP|nr:putative deoxyhypusine synthase [Trypanosoma conorhini]RNF19005.1 putative deoxyhypusine synthase [Trypanosoma conorhini]